MSPRSFQWQANGKRALVVDDSATSGTLLQAVLEGYGVLVDRAANAAELRLRLSAMTYDLILLDYRLPDGDGLDLLPEIRERFPETTLVMVTGKSDLHTATDALRLGADGFVDKKHLQQGPDAFRLVLENATLHRERLGFEREMQGLREELRDLITHDLRAPAANASVALRMFQKEPRDELVSTALRNLNVLFERLDRYLEDSQVEAGEWSLKSELCSPCALLEAVLERASLAATRRGQRLEWERRAPQTWLLADPGWLARAMENLLDNAVKYSPEGGRISVLTRVGEGAWQMEVSDRGDGIPLNLQVRVFERHFRTPTARATARGTGLGLGVVRKVAAAMGGSVEVESSGVVGEGCRFRLSLPLQGPS